MEPNQPSPQGSGPGLDPDQYPSKPAAAQNDLDSGSNPATEPGASPLRLFILVLLVGMIGFVIYRTNLNGGGGPSKGEQASFEWNVVDLNGERFDLTQFEGQTVFLNVWATWCGPCVMEFPSIIRLSENPQLDNVTFLCVAVSDNLESVRRFTQARSMDNVTILLANEETPAVFQTAGIPATFLIDPNGTIVESQVGMDEWDKPEVVNLLARISTEES